MAWVAVGTAVVGAAAGAKSASDARKEGSKSRRAQQALNEQAQNAFTPVQVFGPGGAGANFGGQRTPSLVAGGIDFAALAGLGAQNAAGGGSFQQGPVTSSGTVIGPNGPVQAGGPGGALGGRFDINPNSTAGLDPLGRTNPDFQNATELGGVSLNLGDLDPARAGLAQLATQNIGQAGLAQNAANNPQLQALFQAFQSAGADAGIGQSLNTFDTLLQGAGGAFGGAAQDLASQQANPFQQGLQNQLFQGASDAFGALPGTQQQARDQQLDLLRQQAQPFEERAFSNLQDNLFATGRLGTTGGGLQTEAFARGLGQADLQRQLSASQEGRNAQQAQLGLAQNQLGSGSALRSLQDQLLSGAQNRFQGISNLSGNLSAQRQGFAQQNFGNLGTLLQNAFAPQSLQQQLQQGFLGNASAGLAGVSGLEGNALNLANFGLNAANAQANARLGGVAGSAVPAQNLASSNAFAQLAGSLGSNTVGNAFSALQNRFGNNNTIPGTAPLAGSGAGAGQAFPPLG